MRYLSLAMRGRPMHSEKPKENAMATRHETRSRPKDAIAMLQADHHKVRQLFRTYRTARDLATQWEIAQHIFDELDVHTELEEVVFYQAVEEETSSLGKRLVLGGCPRITLNASWGYVESCGACAKPGAVSTW